MRMFCGFIWAYLDVYALLSGLWVYKSFLFSCGVLPAVTSPSDAACGRASSPARVGAYNVGIRMGAGVGFRSGAILYVENDFGSLCGWFCIR